MCTFSIFRVNSEGNGHDTPRFEEGSFGVSESYPPSIDWELLTDNNMATFFYNVSIWGLLTPAGKDLIRRHNFDQIV